MRPYPQHIFTGGVLWELSEGRSTGKTGYSADDGSGNIRAEIVPHDPHKPLTANNNAVLLFHVPGWKEFDSLRPQSLKNAFRTGSQHVMSMRHLNERCALVDLFENKKVDMQTFRKMLRYDTQKQAREWQQAAHDVQPRAGVRKGIEQEPEL